MSMVILLLVLRHPPYDAVRWWCRPRRTSVRPPEPSCSRAEPLLRVELDDQLFLDRGVDDLPRRDRVHEHPELVRDDLEPRRHGTLPGLRLGDLERQHRARLLGHLDDVVR